MFTIKWTDPYCGARREVSFTGKWERFRHCNAAVCYTEQHSPLHVMHEEVVLRIERWYFISYATPMIIISRYINLATGKVVKVNADVANDIDVWSATSKRQLHWFLNDLAFFHSVSVDYYEIMHGAEERMSAMETVSGAYVIYHLNRTLETAFLNDTDAYITRIRF